MIENRVHNRVHIIKKRISSEGTKSGRPGRKPKKDKGEIQGKIIESGVSNRV
jgi:hypothetical protein